MGESFIANLIIKGQHLSGLSSVESNPFLCDFVLLGWCLFYFAFIAESKHFPSCDFHFCISLISPPFFCSRQSPPSEDAITSIPLGAKAPKEELLTAAGKCDSKNPSQGTLISAKLGWGMSLISVWHQVLLSGSIWSLPGLLINPALCSNSALAKDQQTKSGSVLLNIFLLKSPCRVLFAPQKYFRVS